MYALIMLTAFPHPAATTPVAWQTVLAVARPRQFVVSAWLAVVRTSISLPGTEPCSSPSAGVIEPMLSLFLAMAVEHVMSGQFCIVLTCCIIIMSGSEAGIESESSQVGLAASVLEQRRLCKLSIGPTCERTRSVVSFLLESKVSFFGSTFTM